ncbi:DUF397 domain-containing protein [Streptomyces sp. NPDC005900]|uniref:DUF397 domain-containing protein n=1 Tax=Streptomyces sp. NPDC005900 TaxID=3154569 RepID=UPI0034040C1B
MTTRPTLDELAAVGGWHKSSYSAANNECVEVARPPAGGWVAVRDSKDVDVVAIAASSTAWAAFIGGLVAGDV